jgi:hypothetical protein
MPSVWVVVQRQLQILRGQKAEPEHTCHQHEAGDTAVAETAVAEDPHGHQRILGPALPCHEKHQRECAADSRPRIEAEAQPVSLPLMRAWAMPNRPSVARAAGGGSSDPRGNRVMDDRRLDWWVKEHRPCRAGSDECEGKDAYLGLDPASTALVELEQRWFITGTSPGFGCEIPVQLLERSDRGRKHRLSAPDIPLRTCSMYLGHCAAGVPINSRPLADSRRSSSSASAPAESGRS